MKNKTQIISTLKILILALIIGVGLQYAVAAGSWTAAPANPPSGNVDTPINAGNMAQVKLGSLFVNTDTNSPFQVGFVANGESWFNGKLRIIDGSQGDGKVLTSDKDGYTSWKEVSPVGTNLTWYPANVGEDTYTYVQRDFINYYNEDKSGDDSRDTCDGNVKTDFTCSVTDTKTCTDYKNPDYGNDDLYAQKYTVKCVAVQVPTKPI
jgi:hypothetical protein